MGEDSNLKVCLPFFRSATKEFSLASQRHIRQRTRQDGFLSQIGNHPIFEGRVTSIKQADQSVRDSEIGQFEAELTSKFTDLNNLDRNYVEDAINKIASQFREKISKSFIELMHEITEKTGNVFDARGGPLTNEMVLEMQRSMPPLSDPEGDENYVFVVHPDMMPKIAALEAEFQNSPDLQEKFRKIKEERIEQYRSDQLARKLVG